jgi:bacteriocin biosynthesis cyclodehydratase domain-containing protein
LLYQQRLSAASVLVYGLGRIGSHLVRLLTACGVGSVLGVDDGDVTMDDVYADSWYSQANAGTSRLEALAGLVKAANPQITFEPITRDQDIHHALDQATLAVLATDIYHPREYLDFNQACLGAQATWISCRATGFECNIGPLVIPGETPCFACLTERLQSNAGSYNEYIALHAHLNDHVLPGGSLMITHGVDLAAHEIVKVLTGFAPPSTYSHMYSMNLLTLEARLHPVLKIPRCASCGVGAVRAPSVQLWSDPAEARFDGSL